MVCQVLRWLGVAELGRAQLVCRQWRDLIRGAERCDDHDHSSGADHVLKDSIADDLWRAAFLQTWPLPSLELAPTSELGSGNHTSEEEDDDDDDSKPSVRLADEEEDDAGGCAGGTDNDALLGGCRWMQIARERWILQKKNTTQPRAADEEGAEEDAIADDATKRNEKGFGDIVEQMRASVSELLEDPQQLTSAHAHAALSALAATVLYRAIKARYRIEPAHGMDDGESEYHAVEAVFYSLTTGEPVYVFYTYRYKALLIGHTPGVFGLLLLSGRWRPLRPGVVVVRPIDVASGGALVVGLLVLTPPPAAQQGQSRGEVERIDLIARRVFHDRRAQALGQVAAVEFEKVLSFLGLDLIPHVELLLVGEHDLLHALVLVVPPLHFDQQLLVGRPEQLIPRGQVGQLLEQEGGLAPPLLKRSLVLVDLMDHFLNVDAKLFELRKDLRRPLERCGVLLASVFDLLGRFLDALKPIVGQGERTRELLRPLADAGQVNISGLGARSTLEQVAELIAVRGDGKRNGGHGVGFVQLKRCLFCGVRQAEIDSNLGGVSSSLESFESGIYTLHDRIYIPMQFLHLSNFLHGLPLQLLYTLAIHKIVEVGMLAREKTLFETARLERIKDRLQRFVHLVASRFVRLQRSLHAIDSQSQLARELTYNLGLLVKLHRYELQAPVGDLQPLRALPSLVDRLLRLAKVGFRHGDHLCGLAQELFQGLCGVLPTSHDAWRECRRR